MKLKLIATDNFGFYSEVGLEQFAKNQAKLTAKQIYKWGNEDCPHSYKDSNGEAMFRRRHCDECWKELLEVSK